MPFIDRYLELAIQQRASDIHFSSGESVRLRVDGDLLPLDEATMVAGELERLLFEILTPEEKDRFQKNSNLDKSYAAEGIGNFRINIFMTRRGIAAVLRSIPTKIPTLEDLGLPEVVLKLTELPKGLVLVTGPTGSGKSTTLASMLNHINQTYPYHILTAEDPVEFVHSSKQCLVSQREIGTNCPTFADALKYALREDPDVILVGELRDLETIALALTAAETGHLVFGTLHTRGAAASIDRVIDSFPASQQAMIRTMLSESLAAVISQSLLKRADGKGRVAAYEIMVVNHAIANLVREGKTFQIPSIIQTARKEGMTLMDQHIKELVQKGVVTQEEASSNLSDGGGMATKKTTAPAPARSLPSSKTALPGIKPPPVLKPIVATATGAPAPAPAATATGETATPAESSVKPVVSSAAVPAMPTPSAGTRESADPSPALSAELPEIDFSSLGDDDPSIRIVTNLAEDEKPTVPMAVPAASPAVSHRGIPPPPPLVGKKKAG